MKWTNRNLLKSVLAAGAILLLLAAAGCMSGRQEMDDMNSMDGMDKAEGNTDNDTREGKFGTLTDMQYRVTQECGTEPAFANAYWNNKKPGIYVDVVSGEALFSSKSKFSSGTGWPSFFKPLEEDNIVTKSDTSHGMRRVEVKSRQGDSHLGHVFNDGPEPTGKRFCINSAALRFIPAEELENEGYGQYASLFPSVTDTKEAEEKRLEKATFGAGCFWGVEAIFKKVPGVVETSVGYAGGETENPGYREVCSGKTGHAEVVQLKFDPEIVSYKELLDYFWRMHNPTTPNQQGPNYGTQYRSLIIYHNGSQKAEAEASRKAFEASGVFSDPVMTAIEPADTFYPAENYHQDYYEKNGGHVCHTLREK